MIGDTKLKDEKCVGICHIVIWKDMQVWERSVTSDRSSFTQYWFFKEIVLRLIEVWEMLQ